MTDDLAEDEWTCHHFSQSNPAGPGQGDPAALLRRVADSIDALGEVWIQDIVFHAEQTGGEEDLSMTVYYAKEPRPDDDGDHHAGGQPRTGADRRWDPGAGLRGRPRQTPASTSAAESASSHERSWGSS